MRLGELVRTIINSRCMPKKMPVTFDTVRDLALQMTDVKPGAAYGAPAVKVHGNLLACVPVNKSAEPNSAVVCIDFDLRNALIEQKPDIYYVTEHYAGYPAVLVRLPKIRRGELQELLGLSWSFVSAKKPARGSRAKPNSKPTAKSEAETNKRRG
jgi:hypothetical protein